MLLHPLSFAATRDNLYMDPPRLQADRRGWFFMAHAGVRNIARRFQPQRKETGKRLRVNDQIRISPVRLVDEDAGTAEIVEVDEARRRAQDAGLDLVEVSPQSTPPVCRIMDYGKWKYQQKKKEQKNKAHSKQSELKEVRVRPKIDEHDLSIKMGKAKQFLEEGHKVQFTMLFRGREMAHRDIGVRILQEAAAKLEEISKIETHPRPQGRRMTMVLAPDKGGKKEEKKKPPKPAEGAGASGGAASKPAETPASDEGAKTAASA